MQIKEQKLYEEQADVFVNAWGLIKGACRHLINMWLRGEEAAAVGNGAFWVWV